MGKSYKNNLRSIHVHISIDLYNKLKLIAGSEDRSLSAQVRRIVRESVHQWEDALHAEEMKELGPGGYYADTKGESDD